MAFKSGYIYHFSNCKQSNPVKDKYALCMSVKQNLFYLINSCSNVRPYQYEKEFVVILNSFQINILKHNSYINVKRLKIIASDDYDNFKEYEKVSQKVWLDIKKMCSKHLSKKINNHIFGK